MGTYKIRNRFFSLLFFVSFLSLCYFETPLYWRFRPINDISVFLPPNLLIDDSWYGVYSADKYIGYSHSFMQALEVSRGGGYLLRNTTALEIPILGVMKQLHLESEVMLSKNHSLRSAIVHLSSSGYSLKSTLRQKKGNAFFLSIAGPAHNIKKEVTFSPQLINSSFSPVFVSYLPLGQQTKFSFFDPILEKTTQVYLANKGPASITLGSKQYDGIEFALEVEGVKGRILTDAKGQLLIQEFLGFTLRKEEPVELFDKKTTAEQFDLIKRFTVKTDRIADTEALQSVTAKITGISKEFMLSSFNQRYEPDTQLLTITKKTPQLFASIPITADTFTPYLAEDDYIVFRNTELEETAHRIIGDERNAYKIVQLLSEWIDKNIQKIPTITIPRSLDVYQLRQGDCGELSALLVAFLRSVGIPAYVNVGLVYQEGRFFYHAWVSAFVGEWIDTDPALEQLIADATHIKLIEGLRGQFEIFQFIDKIKLDIVNVRYRSKSTTQKGVL